MLSIRVTTFLGFDVDIEDAGLAATAHRHTSNNDLVEFIRALAPDWKGWPATRTWEGVDHDLRILAQSRRSHTILQISLSDTWNQPTWTAEAEIRVEAGEEMDRLAEALSQFFTDADSEDS